MSSRVFFILGSNLGNKLEILSTSQALIMDRIGPVLLFSSVYQTAPWGVLEQPVFLNQVLLVETSLLPEEVLRIILEIEQELGRIRFERWGARVIDIDILYYDSLVIDNARLTLPHPRLHERRFTLIPLHEIAPDFIHPILLKTSDELLRSCEDQGEVVKIS